MTDPEIQQYLEDNGYPAHIVEGGREYLIKRYADFVDEVERGYEYGLHEYRHDLDIRGVIAILDLDACVADGDQRLARMLTGTDRRVWESLPGEPFWDFGYPHNARGRLMRDLVAAGLA
mgnify:CR=1 FL=1